MERWGFWWDILFRPAWWWVVVIPWAILGVLQGVRDEIPSEVIQERLKLLNILPDWPWYSWLFVAMGFSIIIVLESAYRRIKGIERGHISDALKLRADYEDRLLAARRASVVGGAPAISVVEHIHPFPQQTTAAIEVRNDSPFPIRCRAQGTLLDSNIHLRNGDWTYAIKWLDESEGGEEIELPRSGDATTLEIVTFANFPRVRIGRFQSKYSSIVCLIFHRANIRQPYFTEARQRRIIKLREDIWIHMAIRISFSSAIDPTEGGAVEYQYEIRPGPDTQTLWFRRLTVDVT